MATKTSQRIAILIIAIVMTVGTIGSFVVIVLANNNQASDAAAQQKALDDYKKQQAAAAEAHAASSKPLDGYSATPFDKASITSLGVEVLKEGTGATVKADSTITANYFGWTSDGKIFDSSNQDGKVTPATFSLSGVIKGWTQGLTGQKVGSVVRLTIPSDLAYGAAGSPPSIGPNEPLEFIVEINSIQ